MFISKKQLSKIKNCSILVEGGYSCKCATGYEGKGKTCWDIDECEKGIDDCGANSYCTNNEGSFWCNCTLGYMEIDLGCVDVDECTMGLSVCRNTNECETIEHNCDINADCYDNGTYFCECIPGFEGNGLKGDCHDIDECHRATHYCSDYGIEFILV